MQMVLREGASELSEREREYLVIVNRKIRYLRELSDDFFELTELGKEIDNAEKGDNRKDRIKLTALVTDTILGQNAWIEERGLQVTFDLPDKEIIIESNEHALRRILENLFSNAKKYANSELAVSLKVQNEGVWAITLQNDYADAGKIDIAKLFDPFYRSEARSGQGSGLGLYVVKNLAGWLGYEVQAGIEGAYFFITISDNNGTEE